MAAEFDPYSTWLGIRDAESPLSHYQLLGLKEFEDNALAISIAADAAVTRLKHTDPGDRRGRWQQTLDEVTLAKLCLTNRTRKVQYDLKLRERRGIPQAVPPGEASSEPATGNVNVIPSAVVATPGGNSPATTSPMPATSQPAFAPVAQPAFVRMPVVQPQPSPVGFSGDFTSARAVMQSSPPMAMPAPQAVPVGLLTPRPAMTEPGFAPVELPTSPELSVPPASHEPDLEAPFTQTFSRRSRARSAPNATLWGGLAAVALVALSAFVVLSAVNRAEVQLAGNTASEEASPKSKPENDTTGNSPAEASARTNGTQLAAPTITTTSPASPAREPRVPGTVAMTQIEVPEEHPRTSPAPPQSAEPEQPAPVQPPAQTAEQKAAFEQALQNARAALGARKLPLAQEELKTAKANVGTADQDTQLARMEELYGYVEGFWKAVFESIKGLQATDTIPVGNTEIAIVEADGEKLTIRAAGRNLSYTLKDMPGDLAVLLAKRWFKPGVPANDIYLGAFHAVDPQGNPNEARRCWEAATRAGASAESLMPLLDERTLAFVAKQQPVPKKPIVNKTRAALRRAMASEFQMARTLDQKLSLARQLLDAAQQNDDPVQRYTLLDEALSLATAAGSATDINAALDGLIAGYDVDAWELRADAFAKAADNANNPLVAKPLAQEMLEIVDRAISEKQPKAALKLCNAFLTAAKAGKDLELVRQAREKKAQLTGRD